MLIDHTDWSRSNSDFLCQTPGGRMTFDLKRLIHGSQHWRRLNPFMRLSAAILVLATLSQMLSTEPIQASAASVVLVGAGDISSCDNSNDEATAKLLDNIS